MPLGHLDTEQVLLWGGVAVLATLLWGWAGAPRDVALGRGWWLVAFVVAVPCACFLGTSLAFGPGGVDLAPVLSWERSGALETWAETSAWGELAAVLAIPACTVLVLMRLRDPRTLTAAIVTLLADATTLHAMLVNRA
jgi:hypothetical protein